MNLIYGWDEQAFKDIAERSGSKQAKRDVSYCRTVIYHNARKLICIRYGDIGGVLAYYNKDDVKIVMVAVDEIYKRQGIATALVAKVISIAQKAGKKRVYTRTKAGVGFYSSMNFQIIDRIQDDFIMELVWTK